MHTFSICFVVCTSDTEGTLLTYIDVWVALSGNAASRCPPLCSGVKIGQRSPRKRRIHTNQRPAARSRTKIMADYSMPHSRCVGPPLVRGRMCARLATRSPESGGEDGDSRAFRKSVLGLRVWRRVASEGLKTEPLWWSVTTWHHGRGQGLFRERVRLKGRVSNTSLFTSTCPTFQPNFTFAPSDQI